MRGLGQCPAYDEKQRVVVGLSGGVDSAVTARLLKQQGHEVVGIFMKNWEDDDDDEYCSSRQDFLDAASVADVLGIEIEHVNFAAEYKDRVFAEFLREYQAGRTPNPDVLCNAEIKFKAFLDHAMRLGAEKIATGHYARVRFNEATRPPRAAQGPRPGKDQSYFLHRLNQAQLAQTLFPVGELHKTEVRRIADEIGLPNAKQEGLDRHLLHRRAAVPRVPQPLPGPRAGPDPGRPRPHARRARRPVLLHAGPAPGPRHRRREGQSARSAAAATTRRGSSRARTSPTNTLCVVQGHDHPVAAVAPRSTPTTRAGSRARRRRPARSAAKTRYRQADAACRLAPRTAPMAHSACDFAEPQWAVTPGQSAVLYDGEVCLGGGVIASAG